MRRKPDHHVELPGVDDLTDRGSGRHGLPGMATEAVDDAIDRRTNRMQRQMSPDERQRAFGRLQPGLAFLDCFGARPGQQQFQLRLGRLLC